MNLLVIMMPSANQDDGTCNILGCTEPSADNYNALANQDDATHVLYLDV